MGRKAKRRSVWPDSPRWRAVRNGWGRWVIVDEQGREVLRDPDPYQQMVTAHLAAAAPGLRDALGELARRLRYLELPYARDAKRVAWAQGELDEAKPSGEAILQVMAATYRQPELDLEDESA